MLWVGATWAGNVPDVRDLYARSVTAYEENRRLIANYLFREHVTQTVVDHDGRQVERTSSSYEVQMVDGRLRHRLIAQDGSPVTGPTAERQRRGYPYVRLGALHHLKFTGESVENGRDCWTIAATPKRFARPKSDDEKRMVLSNVKVWLDKQTLNKVRMDIDDRDGDEHVSYQFAERDGSVWLVTAIRVRVREGKRTRYTEQLYSDYRRFLSESTVRATDTP